MAKNIVISDEVHAAWKEYCDNHAHNMGALIEVMIKQRLERAATIEDAKRNSQNNITEDNE